MLLRVDQKLLILWSFYLTLQLAEANELSKARMKVYCNEFVPYGKPTPIVISMKLWPVKTTITVSLSTPGYLLALFEVGNGSEEMATNWKKTSSISQELSELGIRRRRDKWKYEEGFWTNLTGVFWTASDKFLTLLGRMESFSRRLEVKEVIPIEVNLPADCTPQIILPQCSLPDSPRKIIITRGFQVQAIFLEKCNLTISGAYNWSLSDAVGLTQFASYSTDRPLLKVLKYSLRFPATYEHLRDFYLLQVEVEGEGLHYAARCYLKVVMGQVEAVISGGRHRRSGYRETLWMNGSLSYDFSKRPSDIQFSSYHWDCKSADVRRNRFCRFNLSLEAAFSIPAKSLKKGCKYLFRLQVFRDHNPRISSQKLQEVTITDRSVLQVLIECLRNCRRDFYTPNAKVHLNAICLNCGRLNLVYQWSVDGQKVFNSKEAVIHIQTVANRTSVQLVISAEDGRYGKDVKTLFKNSGPTAGECSVSPQEGQEAITSFVPCCRKFASPNEPIEYWFYAGSVLLESCLDCSCEVKLPVTNSLKILACDALSACHSTSLKVKVVPLERVPTQPKALREYMNSSPHNIRKMLEEGLLSSYLQALNAIATRISLADSGITLLNGFKDIQPYTRSSLGLLANLTLTLAQRLPSSNPKTQVLLTLLVKKLNDNLGEIILNDNVRDLLEQPFMNITLACLEVFRLMEKIIQQSPPPPPSIYVRYHRAFSRGSLDQHVVDKLFAEMPKTRTPQGNWLNSSWEAERLSRSLSYVRAHQSRGGNDIPPAKAAMLLQCLEAVPEDTLNINTTDGLYTVDFTPELFKELLGENSTDICFKLISVSRKLNWWYPDEKRPSARLLSVRVFQRNKDYFTKEIPLVESVVPFKGSMTSRSTEQRETDRLNGTSWELAESHSMYSDRIFKVGRYIDVMMRGRLESLREVRQYRILLDEQTVLAVHFTQSTHKLQVLLKMEVKPLWSEISNSWCVIPADTTNKTILLRNNCLIPKRAYMAVRVWSELSIRSSPNTPLPDGPAVYTFAFQIRSCSSWIYSLPEDKQRWSQGGCYPSMELGIKQGMHCTCEVLGTYTNYLYYTRPIRVPADIFTDIKPNLWICAFYVVLILVLVVWIFWLICKRNALPSKTIRVPMSGDEASDEEDEEIHDLLLKVRTGGRINAQTTASITLVLLTPSRERRRFKIRQDPEHIFVERNTAFHLWLRTREIRLPTRMMIYHDGAGRYPSWYLRRIEVNDIQTRETQIFLVQQWVNDEVINLHKGHIFVRGEARYVENWCFRFKLHFEILFVNWSLWQPVTGSWRESNHFPSMSRAKRFCVFISKLAIGFTCCACYFGETNIESLQLCRGRFLSLKDVLALTLIVCMVDILFQLVSILLASNVS